MTFDVCPNPYQPTRVLQAERSSDWYLERACAYYRRMAAGMIIWFVLYCSAATVGLLWGQEFSSKEWGPPVVFMLMFTVFFVKMYRIARLLPADVERYYRQARWYGILAGAFFFPVLSIPAYVAVRRLARCRALRLNSETDPQVAH